MTRGHNIVADGWAGASNPHPLPNPPPSLKHTRKVLERLPSGVHNSGKMKKKTTCLANLCWTEDINYKKSVTVWKLCERSFKCVLAGYSSLIPLEMAQEWIKTLPYSDLWFNWIKKVLKRSSSLWRALTFKRFDLQI